MNVLEGSLIVVAVTAVTVTAMLLVRRRAPAGSYFSDGDRASGVFGVLATGFSVLLGFIIFLAFQAYDSSRAGAATEATLVAQMAQTAQFLPSDVSQQLTGEVICYARSVAGAEWDAVDAGTLGDAVNPWGVRMFRTIRSAQPKTDTEQSAYDRWMDESTQRQEARDARLHSADGIIPAPLWIALGVISLAIFGYMLFFADSGERALTQATLMGTVTVVITVLMLLVVFFNHPHGNGIGTLKPTEMQRTIRLLNTQLKAVGITAAPPCDERGVAR
jgi:hypothetical protein